MKIAIASGKGGTGKTTVATNLAIVMAAHNDRVRLVDCDVEAPNCHIFLQPDIETTEPLCMSVPVVSEDRCDGCGICAEVCQFNAIACVKSRVITFPELCHGCGACLELCPKKAIGRGERLVGFVESGVARGIDFTQGRLQVGETMARPLIRQVKKSANGADLMLYDAPPGTSCPAIETVSECDCALLVTEPTPFGLNDLILAVEMLRALNVPFSVIVNRTGTGDDGVTHYCRVEGIQIVAEIPYDRNMAEAYAEGVLPVDVIPELRERFQNLRKWLRVGLCLHAQTAQG